MFPFASISQALGCFLMWFSLFIQYLLDNIGADSSLRCHIGNVTMKRATTTTTQVKRKKLQHYSIAHSAWTEPLFVELSIHDNVGFIKSRAVVLAAAKKPVFV